MSLFHKKKDHYDRPCRTDGVTAPLDELIRLRILSRGIKLFSRQKSQSDHVGQTLARTHGRGMEFEEVRSYQQGDDIRLINWPMTARTGRPYTKIYQEERDKPLYLLMDQSFSMHFGTKVAFKSVIAARVAALMLWSAFEQGHQVGGILFNEHEQLVIHATPQRKTVLKMLAQLSHYANLSTVGRSMADYTLCSGLKILQQKRIKGALLSVVSDFTTINDELLQCLTAMSASNDILLFFIYDPLERQAPHPNLYYISDGHEKMLLNTYDKNQVTDYNNHFYNRFERIRSHCRKYRIRFIALATEDELVNKINAGSYRYESI